jgi:hypothetical protein
MTDADFHPIQVHELTRPHSRPMMPSTVTLRAYEVYCELWHAQPALVEGGCRGGFGIGELTALLYARSFPKAEWRKRFDEAIKRPENHR